MERKEKIHCLIHCFKCGDFIGEFDLYDSSDVDVLKRSHEGLNHGIGGRSEYECFSCRRDRERAYDNYVDPTGFYQAKVLDPHA